MNTLTYMATSLPPDDVCKDVIYDINKYVDNLQKLSNGLESIKSINGTLSKINDHNGITRRIADDITKNPYIDIALESSTYTTLPTRVNLHSTKRLLTKSLDNITKEQLNYVSELSTGGKKFSSDINEISYSIWWSSSSIKNIEYRTKSLFKTDEKLLAFLELLSSDESRVTGIYTPVGMILENINHIFYNVVKEMFSIETITTACKYIIKSRCSREKFNDDVTIVNDLLSYVINDEVINSLMKKITLRDIILSYIDIGINNESSLLSMAIINDIYNFNIMYNQTISKPCSVNTTEYDQLEPLVKTTLYRMTIWSGIIDGLHNIYLHTPGLIEEIMANVGMGD